MSRINLNDYPELQQYVKNKIKDLCNISAILMSYICLNRPGYIEVNQKNIYNEIIRFPFLSQDLVEYIITQILKVDFNIVASYEINLGIPSNFIFENYKPLSEQLKNIYKNNSSKQEKGSAVEKRFVSKIKEKLKEKDFKSLSKEYDVFIHPHALRTIYNYGKWIVSNIILDLDYQYDSRRLIENIKNFETKLQNTSNISKPQDRGLMEEENIIVNSILWLLCGVVDWLDKETIETKEFVVIKQLLLNDVVIETNERITEIELESYSKKILKAIFDIKLYADPETVKKITLLFFNLKKLKELINSYKNIDSILNEYLVKDDKKLKNDNSNNGKIYKQYKVVALCNSLSHYVS
jgi:hypothetical protein